MAFLARCFHMHSLKSLRLYISHHMVLFSPTWGSNTALYLVSPVDVLSPASWSFSPPHPKFQSHLKFCPLFLLFSLHVVKNRVNVGIGNSFRPALKSFDPKTWACVERLTAIALKKPGNNVCLPCAMKVATHVESCIALKSDNQRWFSNKRERTHIWEIIHWRSELLHCIALVLIW